MAGRGAFHLFQYHCHRSLESDRTMQVELWLMGVISRTLYQRNQASSVSKLYM